MKRILLLFAALAVAALAVTAVASADQGRHHRGDRNRDGLPDKWERAHHLSLKVNQAPRDQDRDGLNNKREFEHGTDPNKADTDNNGVDDENEVNPVGTIASFTNGTLTITLANGQTVSGQVTPQTEIKCESENGDFRGDGGGDNSGPGSSGSGDDDGANHDAGDDHGDDNTGTTTTPTTTAPAPPSNSGPGDQGDDDNDNNNEHACGPNPLTAGAAVKDAEAKLTSTGLVFEEIELR